MVSQQITKTIGLHLPIHCRTIVLLRTGRNGVVTEDTQSIVLGQAPATGFSRAYGPEVYVTSYLPHNKTWHVSRVDRASVWPVGKAKRIPQVCKAALAKYKATHEKGR